MLKTLLNVIDKIGSRMCGQGEFRFIQFFLFILIQNSEFSQRLIYMTRRENTLNKFHLKNKYSSFQKKSIFRARSFRRNTFLVQLFSSLYEEYINHGKSIYTEFAFHCPKPKIFMTQNLFLNQNFFWTQILLIKYCSRPNSFNFYLGLIQIFPKLNTLDLSLVFF